MEIKSEPKNCGNESIVLINCSCCGGELTREIRKKYSLLWECGACKYLFLKGCSCEWGDKDYLYIICKSCKYPTCIKCGKKNDEVKYCFYKKNKNYVCYFCKLNPCIKCGYKCISVETIGGVCENCIEKAERKKFWKKWYDGTVREKLEYYGMEKLKILANKKNMISTTHLTREELIDKLEPLATLEDFPIR